MSDYKDYYKILGIGKNATDADIKKAFKTQARKYHPDMHPESKKAEMTEKFKDVNEAYEVLSDKQKRTIYDQVGSSGYQNYARGGGASASTGRGSSAYGGGAGGGAGGTYYQYGGNPFGGGNVHFNGTGGFNASDFSDFFQQIFGGGFGGFGGSGKARRGGGVGGANPFAGFGGGAQPQADSETELTISLSEAYRGGIYTLSLNGREVQVKFPAKISDGSKIKLKGLGSGGGDLYVNVKISANKLFRLDGKDIYQSVDIMPWTAALGGSIAVSMPDGEAVKIKVPAGSHSGRKLKLSGRGLGRTGSMYVELIINNPNVLNDRQRALFEQLRELDR